MRQPTYFALVVLKIRVYLTLLDAAVVIGSDLWHFVDETDNLVALAVRYGTTVASVQFITTVMIFDYQLKYLTDSSIEPRP